MNNFFKFMFSKDDIPGIICIVAIIVFLIVFPILKTMSERQQCGDYVELMGVEYVYKKSLGCFIKNKENKWKFINFEKLKENDGSAD